MEFANATRFFFQTVGIGTILGILIAIHRFLVEAKDGIALGRRATFRDFAPVLCPLTKIIYALIAFAIIRNSAMAKEGSISIPVAIALFSLGVTAIVQGWVISRLLPGLMAVPASDKKRKTMRFSFVWIVCGLFETLSILPIFFTVSAIR